VAFVCTFIPRSTLDRFGLLDERFGVNADGTGPRGYGCDDDDMCWRVREGGLKLGIYDGCFVDHGTLKSTFRGDPARPADVVAHEKVFAEKWGRSPRNPACA
jgi:GT2 family glycosyltransferase